MSKMYFFGKRNNFVDKYNKEEIHSKLCKYEIRFDFSELEKNEFFSGIIEDGKIKIIVRYELDKINAKSDDEISLNYLYQKQLINSTYKDDDLIKHDYSIKYIKITFICSTTGYGTNFLNKMENYYLPDIIVISNPIKSALHFYYKNNFKTDFKTDTNCTQGKLIFKVPSYSRNIYSKIINKLEINSIGDLDKRKNLKQIFTESNSQHLLFSDGIIDETKINFLIDYLLDDKNINNKDINGDTILTVLIKNKISHTDFVKIIEKFTNIDYESVLNFDLIQELTSEGVEIFELLIEKGEKGEKGDYYKNLKNELLIHASRVGNTKVVESLIKKGADVNSKNIHGWTPLIEASNKGYKEIVDLLVTNKSDVNLKNKEKNNALIKAVTEGHKEIVELLLKKGSEFDFKNMYEWTPLIVAVNKGHKEIVELLLKTEKIDIKSIDKNGRSLLIRASEKGHKEIVELLLNQKTKIDINLIDHYGWTALIVASFHGHKEIVELLLKNGADPNKNQEGYSALFFASKKGYVEIVELLLKKGADVCLTNMNNETAETVASNVEILNLIISAKKSNKRCNENPCDDQSKSKKIKIDGKKKSIKGKKKSIKGKKKSIKGKKKSIKGKS